jgi:SWI/SNF-related matrix-associated actin-dependent regulator 1 of chromatin subfamily A
VPDSSPLNPDSQYRPYRPYSHPQSHDVAAIPSMIHSNQWGPLNGLFGGDPLSAPSGFTGYNGGPHASPSRHWGDMTRRVSDVEDMRGEGPPRKRMRGSSQDPLNVIDSPDSPGIQRLGQGRRIIRNGVTGLSLSSDESMPEIQDLSEGSSRPRLVRGRAGSDGPPALATDQQGVEDPKFIRFAITTPEHPKAIVRLAWEQAGGDVRKASSLLQDRGWLKNPSGIVQPSPESCGQSQGNR